MLKFITWNVNSLRARFLHLQQLIDSENPDVIMLQEVRADESKLDKQALQDLGYNVVYSLFGGKSGVMILSRREIDSLSTSFATPNVERHNANFLLQPNNILEGRYIEICLVANGKSFCLSSVYFPNGGNSSEDDKNFRSVEESERFNYKLAFYDDFIAHSKTLLTKADYTIIGGDFNVAREARDVHNPKAFEGVPCFHPLEHARFATMLENGYEDFFRLQNPNLSVYTWWDYRKFSYPQNKGLRIDYIIGSQNIKQNFTTQSTHLTYYRELDRPSDHCPIALALNPS